VVTGTMRSNSFRLKHITFSDLLGRTTLGSTTIPSLRNEAICMQDSSWILWNAEISSVVEAHSLWQIWQVFALEKSMALGPCLFFSAHHSGYHPHA
jgi:hypothetical protein